MGSDIPIRIQQFIGNYIFSLSELEILLFLRNYSDDKWEAEALGKALLMHRPAAEPRLESLCARGLVKAIDIDGIRAYQYGASADLDKIVQDLEKWYASHPVAITTLIFSKPIDNIIRDFADSFRLRKKEDK